MKKVIILGNTIGNPGGFSLKSVREVYKMLLKKDYDVYPYFIRGLNDLERMLNRVPHDGIFVLMYGGFGNDGTLQSFLESMKVNFNNNGSFTHDICYNKLNTYKFLDKLKLNHPKVYETVKFPCIMKDIKGEGGTGVHLIKNTKDYNEYNNENKYTEQFLEGDEYTISVYKGVVGNPIKIVKDDDIWKGNNPKEEFTEFPELTKIRNEVEKDLLLMYDKLKATDGIRVDFIKNNSGIYYFDINSMPILNNDGYFHRSLKGFDSDYNFEFLIEDMYKTIFK